MSMRAQRTGWAAGVWIAAASVMATAAIATSCAHAAPRAPSQSSVISAATADVVVKDLSLPAIVEVTVGQTVGITWPGGNGIWQVDYPPETLVLLTRRDALASPGSSGWVWRAARPGEVELVFTSRAPCPIPPCAENPLQYTVRLRVR